MRRRRGYARARVYGRKAGDFTNFTTWPEATVLWIMTVTIRPRRSSVWSLVVYERGVDRAEGHRKPARIAVAVGQCKKAPLSVSRTFVERISTPLLARLGDQVAGWHGSLSPIADVRGTLRLLTGLGHQPCRDDVRARSGQRWRQTLKRAAAQGYSVLTAMPRVPLSGMACPGGLCLPRCPTVS